MATANDDAAAHAAPDPAEPALEALFRGPRERFVTERNLAAQRLRALGQAEAAARLRTLTKPSISAWTVNQLWWRARPEMEALFDASRRLAAAMREGPAAQAAAGRGRRRTLEALEVAACEVLAEGGHSTGISMLRRVTTTLEALATHVVLGDGPVAGRLVEDLEPPAIERLLGLDAAAFTAPAPDEPAPLVGQPPELEAVTRAERDHQAAAEQAKIAAQRLDDATRHADEVMLEAQRTAQVHEQARALADAARQRADEAERVALRVGAEARREREQVDEARRELAGHIAELDRRSEALRRARQRLAAVDGGEPPKPR